MAYNQPRVPEYDPQGGVVRFLRSLTAFLKGFCLATWREVENIKKRLEALERSGDV